jgi:hypothetical protein
MAGSKSSGAVFFRAAVMLTFLAAIPLVALSGSSLPDVIRKALEKYLPSLSGNKPEKPAETLAEAPPFTGEKSTGGNRESVYAASSPGVLQAAIVPSQIADPGVVPAKYQTPVEGPSVPADRTPAVNDEGFLRIQNRLRSLGAKYYLLETWGNDRRLYRFYCEMGVVGDGDFIRCFEATHSDPVGAMQAVLSQVEDWRAGAR